MSSRGLYFLSSNWAVTGSVSTVALEREGGAERQKHDCRRSDQSGALPKPGCEHGEPGWEKDSYKTTEDGEPGKYRHEHRPAARPEIVSAHNGKSSDE